MKLLVGLFLFLAISSAFAYPAQNPDDDAETIPVLRRQQGSRHNNDADTDPDFKDFKGIVDTGSGYPFFSVHPYNPFGSSFFDTFEETFRKLRESVLNRWWSSIPQPSDFDPSEGNTTSVVKVIDGHKVEINDTVYTKTDDSGNSIFKVRVVNIRPLDSSEETVTTGPGVDKGIRSDEKGSPEEIEKGTQDNEILGNIDSTENANTTHNTLEMEIIDDPPTFSNNPQGNNSPIKGTHEDIEETATNAHTNIERDLEKEIDIINIANKLTDNEKYDIEKLPITEGTTETPFSAEVHKDRETITGESSEEYDDDVNAHDTEWEPISNSNDQNNNNNLDDYESISVDLSNDIAINDMLADQGEPVNPDAEVFSVDEFVPEYKRDNFQYEPIKFETIKPHNDLPPKKK